MHKHRIDQGTMWIEKNIWSKATLRPRHIFCWPQNAHHLRGRFNAAAAIIEHIMGHHDFTNQPGIKSLKKNKGESQYRNTAMFGSRQVRQRHLPKYL